MLNDFNFVLFSNNRIWKGNLPLCDRRNRGWLVSAVWTPVQSSRKWAHRSQEISCPGDAMLQGSRCKPSDTHFRAGLVLLRSPLQRQRVRGFVRNWTRCHQKAQLQSAICQAVFGWVKPFFPQDSCLQAESKRTFQGVSLQSHVLSRALFSNCAGRLRKKLDFSVTPASGSFRKEKKKRRAHAPASPWSSPPPAGSSLSEVSLLHWLAKQLVLIHLSPC